jgi:mono/diheme cytochrome c family protein
VTRTDALRALAGLALVFATSGQVQAQASGTSGSWFERYHPVAKDTLPAATYAGWEQFQVNCSRCHGQDADGTSFAPSLVQALGPDGPVKTETAS